MFNILLVDDDDMVLYITQRMLEFLGYNCFVEIDPIKALKLFKKRPHSYDLIITDQSMLGMNGTELINEMWLIRKDVKFILYSGYDHVESSTDHYNEKASIYYL
jgi:DNA-binding NtrC family response regulator